MTVLKRNYGNVLRGIVYSIDATSGTSGSPTYRLGEGERFIVDYIGMCGKQLFLGPPPRRRHEWRDVQAQPAVVASLERSLEENADVWAELSRY